MKLTNFFHKLPKSLTTITPFSKTLAMILFILLPFIGFYLGIQYSYLLNQVNKTTELTIEKNSSSESPDKNMNWKTYVNSESNWQINYPNDLNVLEREASQIGPSGLGKVIIFSKFGPSQTTGTELHDGISFTIGLQKKDINQSIKELADSLTKPNQDIGSTRTPLKDIIINGHKGIETTVSSISKARVILLEYPVSKDRAYYLIIFAEGPEKNKTGYNAIVEEMLQSFKSYR